MDSNQLLHYFPPSLQLWREAHERGIGRDELISDFFSEFDHPSWFPAYLKTKKFSQLSIQEAELEWHLRLRDRGGNALQNEPLPEAVGTSLKINPEIEIFHLRVDLPERGFAKGLYAFSGGPQPVLKLSSEMAQILDRLELFAEGNSGSMPLLSLRSELFDLGKFEKNLEELLSRGVILWERGPR